MSPAAAAGTIVDDVQGHHADCEPDERGLAPEQACERTKVGLRHVERMRRDGHW
jgi:hypothetical protein